MDALLDRPGRMGHGQKPGPHQRRGFSGHQREWEKYSRLGTVRIRFHPLIEDVTFENLEINGKKRSGLLELNLKTNSHVKNVLVL